MLCPHCAHPRLQVKETRDDGERVLRVRACPTCGWRVTTEEVYAQEQSIPRSIRRAYPALAA